MEDEIKQVQGELKGNSYGAGSELMVRNNYFFLSLYYYHWTMVWYYGNIIEITSDRVRHDKIGGTPQDHILCSGVPPNFIVLFNFYKSFLT